MKKYNSAPSEENTFKLVQKQSNPILKEFPSFIKENNISSLNSQYILWGILNQAEIEDFYSDNLEETNKIRAFVNKHYPAKKLVPLSTEKFRSQRIETYTTTITGNIVFSASKRSQLHIAIFNENNVVIKEVFNASVPNLQEQVIEYEIKLKPEEENQKIIAKAILDGRIFHTWTIIE